MLEAVSMRRPEALPSGKKNDAQDASQQQDAVIAGGDLKRTKDVARIGPEPVKHTQDVETLSRPTENYLKRESLSTKSN